MNLNPLNLLRLSFALKSISQDLILQCLHCIHSSFFTTKDSLYCVAEIQLYYQQLSSHLHSLTSSTSSSSSSSPSSSAHLHSSSSSSYASIAMMTSSEDLNNFIYQIYEISQFCFEIIETNASPSSSSSPPSSSSSSSPTPAPTPAATDTTMMTSPTTPTYSQSSVTLILDLFPTMIQILANLFASNGIMSRMSGNRIDFHQRGPQLMLDCFFAVQWSPCYVVFLCNIVTEIWEYLLPRHKIALKVTTHTFPLLA